MDSPRNVGILKHKGMTKSFDIPPEDEESFEWRKDFRGVEWCQEVE